jgi:hypothetical protein
VVLEFQRWLFLLSLLVSMSMLVLVLGLGLESVLLLALESIPSDAAHHWLLFLHFF